MVTYTETAHAAEFILSEANGARSRANGVGGATLPAGSVVKSTASKLVSYNGSGTVVGILLYDTVLDQAVSYIARDAEVNQKLLTSTEATDGELDAAAIAGLATLGIICRD
ncbi:head decoration protein [Mesorhizobium sp. M0514]|uniref:head decoration protein n=1 Tax=Mesorhizobium sp. M0514 TaxID=2956955 RepID=UPI0033364654